MRVGDNWILKEVSSQTMLFLFSHLCLERLKDSRNLNELHIAMVEDRKIKMALNHWSIVLERLSVRLQNSKSQ